MSQQAGALPEEPAAKVQRKTNGDDTDMADDGEDELLAEQRKWQEQQARQGPGAGGTKAVRR